MQHLSLALFLLVGCSEACLLLLLLPLPRFSLCIRLCLGLLLGLLLLLRLLRTSLGFRLRLSFISSFCLGGVLLLQLLGLLFFLRLFLCAGFSGSLLCLCCSLLLLFRCCLPCALFGLCLLPGLRFFLCTRLRSCCL